MRIGVTLLWMAMYPVPMRPHGAGVPIYISLGWVNNAYNVVFDDDSAMSQGLLYEGIPWRDDQVYGQTVGQEKLVELWRMRALEDPGLVLRNVAVKSLYLLRYFSGTMDPTSHSDDSPIASSGFTLAMGLGLCGAAAYCAVLFFRLRNNRILVIFSGTVGLGIAAFSSLVLIVPYYAGSAIAFCLAIVFILMPATHQLAAETRSDRSELQFQRNTLICKIVGILALLVAVTVTGYTVYRSKINRTEARALLVGDTLQKLNQLRQDFSFRFNRLSFSEQQLVIARLLSSPDRQPLFRATSSSGSSAAEKIFTPILAIPGKGCLSVVARMSRDWKMLRPGRVAGPRNSVLLVLKNADRGSGRLGYLEAPYNYLKIADANWDGRYRMFTLPAPHDIAEGANFFGVSAYNFKDGEHLNALILDLISGNRLYRNGQNEP